MMIVPIDVTVVGIVTDVTFVHDWKTEPAINRIRVINDDDDDDDDNDYDDDTNTSSSTTERHYAWS